MIVRFLGTHNEESDTTGLPAITIDDILAIDAGSLAAALTFAEQEQIVAILLSHGHYDHIRAIPAFAFNNSSRLIDVYGSTATLEVLTSHLLDGVIYPRFASGESFLKRPVLNLQRLEAFQPREIAGYHVLPLPLNHPLENIGFSITDSDGKGVLYLSDTGPGLDEVWSRLDTRPQLMIIDTTYPNRLAQSARDAGHLCPRMLAAELAAFRRVKAYLPQVALVHLNPRLEEEIRKEVGEVSAELGVTVHLTAEGDRVTV